MTREELMRKAIELSVKNVAEGGGPFGAVIAKDGEIIATGVNRVTADHDPTAHAEVSAIREAARKLGTFDLGGCEIYSSCEPCPMCLGAIYWARLDRLYYGNDKHDAAAIGFDDAFIYKELDLEPENRRLESQRLLSREAIKAFEAWQSKTDKTEYQSFTVIPSSRFPLAWRMPLSVMTLTIAMPLFSVSIEPSFPVRLTMTESPSVRAEYF